VNPGSQLSRATTFILAPEQHVKLLRKGMLAVTSSDKQPPAKRRRHNFAFPKTIPTKWLANRSDIDAICGRGMSPAQVAGIRRECCTFIFSVANKLWMRKSIAPQADRHLLDIADTALAMFHRYFSRKAFSERKSGSDSHLNRYDVGMACCFIAGKQAEDPRLAIDVAKISRDTLGRHSRRVFDLASTTRVRGKSESQINDEFVAALLRTERKLLHVCEFEVDIDHARAYIGKKLNGMGCDVMRPAVDRILQEAALQTSLCVQL